MIMTAHQPDFCPYMGLFERIYYSDTFVIFDNVQYQFGYLNNRNKVKISKDKWTYITVPVHAKFGQNINEVEISKDSKEIDKLLRTIKMNYSKTPFFDLIYPKFEAIMKKEHNNLAELNIELYDWFFSEFKLNVRKFRLSELPIHTSGEQCVLDVCKYIDCDEYVSGVGGKNYQDEQKFKDIGVKLTYVDFTQFEYKQKFGTFLPYMSVLDYVFNCGFIIPHEWEVKKAQWQKK